MSVYITIVKLKAGHTKYYEVNPLLGMQLQQYAFLQFVIYCPD